MSNRDSDELKRYLSANHGTMTVGDLKEALGASLKVVPSKDVRDCNACVRASSVVELRFGNSERASSILCVSLCRSCAATLRDNLETLP